MSQPRISVFPKSYLYAGCRDYLDWLRQAAFWKVSDAITMPCVRSASDRDT
jgi:hypothetical protein